MFSIEVKSSGKDERTATVIRQINIPSSSSSCEEVIRCMTQQQLSPVDEDGDGQGHGEDEEDHDGDHLVDGDGLCQTDRNSLRERQLIRPDDVKDDQLLPESPHLQYLTLVSLHVLRGMKTTAL